VQGHIDLADLHSLTHQHRGGSHPGAGARSRDDSGLDLVNDTMMPTHAPAHANGMHQNALMSLARENVLLKTQLQFASHEVNSLAPPPSDPLYCLKKVTRPVLSPLDSRNT